MKEIRRVLHRLATLFRGGAAESELSREINAHLTLLEDQFVADGMSRSDARAAARRAFGGVEQTKELQRDARTFRALSGWSTDLRLGVRMLTKYPGLTIAGGLTLAIAIGLGAAWFDFSSELFRPALPLPDGDRLVEIQLQNTFTGSAERRLLHDYASWRQDLHSVDALGAFRTIDRNFGLGASIREQVRGAEITSSALRLAGVAPFIGRPLIEEDERPGAPPVALIGYRQWQRWFGGRADAIGQSIRLGDETATVVGVMPDGFAFPTNQGLWVPLRVLPSGYAALEGPAITVVGRLSGRGDSSQLEAELAVMVAREAGISPVTHEHLRPEVRRFGGNLPGPYLGLALTHLPILLVLFIACVNVGTLVYARTATREAEIAARFTMGASRSRIVAQLFIEALALVLAAGAVGLTAADWALTAGVSAYYSGDPGGPPFWIEPGLRFTTVVFAIGLAIVAAAALSLLPALKATGRRVQARLATSGERATLRFGRVWTGAMITQVALTAFALRPAVAITDEALRDRGVRQAFPAEEYVAVQVDVDRQAAIEGTPAGVADAGLVYGELERRVAQEPGVQAVAYARALPGLDLRPRRIEIEGPAPSPALVQLIDGEFIAWTEAIGPSYFETFGRRIVGGRDFRDGDRTEAARTVIVNESFVRRFGGGTSLLGRRVRYVGADRSAAGDWLEIVGIAQDIGMTPIGGGEAPYISHPVAVGSLSPAMMAVHVAGDPAAATVRLQTIASQLDPRLRVVTAGSMEDWRKRAELPNLVGAAALVGVVCLGVFLSASGIFALVSVSVARRTRELGIRSALGAGTGRLLRGVFLRVLLLVFGGIVIGNGLLFLLFSLGDDIPLGLMARNLAQTSAVMLAAALMACIQPTLRVLRINPNDALRTL